MEVNEASTREKVIQFLNNNPHETFTYSKLAKEVGSHPIAIGQILKSLGKDMLYRELTLRVKTSNPKRKCRLTWSKESKFPCGN
jgi:hypothetical protein